MPKWLDGLSLSADWFSIQIKDNITTLGAGLVVEGCVLDGDEDLCAQITRDVPVSTINPEIHRISFVGTPYINESSVRAHGVDFEASYTTSVDWFGGGTSVGLRLVGSYMGEQSATDSAGTKTRYEGSLGFPKWTGILSGTYRRGPFKLYMQAKYTDDLLMSRTRDASGYNADTGLYEVSNNVLDSQIIVNSRVNYMFDVFGGFLDLYFNVNNLFDKWPERYLTGEYAPVLGVDQGNGVFSKQDLRGRRYTVGLQFEHGF